MSTKLNPPRQTAGDALRQLRNLNALPLNEKVDRARDIIRLTIDQAGAAHTFVSFSGGRDSTALAIVAREILPSIPLVFQDTGMADPRLIDFVAKWAGDTLVYRPPARHPYHTWAAQNCYPIGAKVSGRAYRRQNPESRVDPSKCCELHKTRPMIEYLTANGCRGLLNGAKGDDSKRHRFKLQFGEILNTRHPWVLAYPIFCWTSDDTRAFLRDACPDYPLHYARQEELGCLPCGCDATRHPNNMSFLRQRQPELHRQIVTETGYGLEILKLAHGLTDAGARQLVARYGWDKLIGEGHLDRIPHPKQGLQ